MLKCCYSLRCKNTQFFNINKINFEIPRFARNDNAGGTIKGVNSGCLKGVNGINGVKAFKVAA